MANKLNVIMIIADTFRRDHLRTYGNGWVDAANIDRFAQRSLVFDQAYIASFPTVPHRHDVLTGRFTATYAPWAPLPGDEITLAQVLGDAGYTTMMIADTPHILENGFYYNRGFDAWDWIRGQETDNCKTQRGNHGWPCHPNRLRSRGQIAHYINRRDWQYEEDRFVAKTMASACRWLESGAGSKPFFLYVDTFDPHEPWDAPQWYVDMYDPGYLGEVLDYPHYAYVEGYLTPEELNHCRALYAAEVTLVDRWVGRLLQRIEDMGLLEDTVVLFTTDHGFLHGEHGIIGKALIREKSFAYIPLYEQISRIPLLVWTPGCPAGRTDAIVQPPDLMPTILEMAGVETPSAVQGKSFLNVINRQEDSHRQVAFSFPHLAAPTASVAVRSGKHSAVICPRRQPTSADPTRAVDGLAKVFGESFESLGGDLLFNLQKDPSQQANIADQHADILDQLRAKFVQFISTETTTDEEVVNLWR